MKKFNSFKFGLSCVVGVLVIGGVFFITQCGGGDNDDDNQQNSNIKTYELSLGGVADNVNLTAGQTTSISFVGHTPGPLRTYKTVTLNLQKILDAGYVETASVNRSPLLDFLSKATSPRSAMAAYQWEVSLRVGDAGNLATVCEDGHSAQYTDSEAAYRGTVCGNEFVFNGGVEGEWGYEEKGTATLNSDGSLRKTSSFVSYDGSCRGDCEDLLYRQEQ